MRWSELHAVEFHLVQALLHDLKAEAWALLRDVPHCRAEARDHRADARRAFAPSMRQKIDIPDLYRDALRRLPDAMDGQAPMALPTKCPLTPEQLLPRRRKIGDVPGRLRVAPVQRAWVATARFAVLAMTRVTTPPPA